MKSVLTYKGLNPLTASHSFRLIFNKKYIQLFDVSLNPLTASHSFRHFMENKEEIKKETSLNPLTASHSFRRVIDFDMWTPEGLS